MYIRNTWYVAAEPAEVDGKLLARTILGKPLVLFRTDWRKLRRWKTDARIALRRFRSGVSWASGFSVAITARSSTPRALVSPSLDSRSCPPKARVASYPVVERYGYVWVWMGAVTPPPDLSTIPEFMFRSEYPGWDGGYGRFESIQANYTLINDNLFDITHAEYVHPELLWRG